MSSFRVQRSVAGAGHKTGVLLLPLSVRLSLSPLLPDGAAEHAVTGLDVRGHDPLDSPKHLAHTLSAVHVMIKLRLSFYHLGTSRRDRYSPSVC